MSLLNSIGKVSRIQPLSVVEEKSLPNSRKTTWRYIIIIRLSDVEETTHYGKCAGNGTVPNP